MNDINYQAAVKEAAKAKFRGRKTVKCRTVPKYPASAEREFRRINRAYMQILRDSLKKHLPKMITAYKEESRKDSRLDDVTAFNDKIRKQILEIAADLEEDLEDFELLKKIDLISRLTQKTSIREWKRIVKDTIGIDIFEDYFKGELYEQAIQRWISSNVSMIKSIPNETLAEMQEIIMDGYRRGIHVRELQKEIQAAYDVSKRRSEMIARDQISTLNAELTKMQQHDAGVKKYRWSSSKDERVRECHQEFDGHIYSWDDPPEDWYTTKSQGIVYTGKKYHPGEAICCRCVAIPVFEWETMNLPIGNR